MISDQQTKAPIFTNKYKQSALVKIVLIILSGAVLVYGFDSQISRTLFYLLVIIWFYFTKDNVLGIAVLFILTINPWGLFYYKPNNWIVQVTSTVGISYASVFPVIIFLKFYSNKLLRAGFLKDKFKPFYFAFAFYYIFLLGWGLVFGHSAASLFDTVLSVSGSLLFFILPVIFSGNQVFRFNELILYFNLIHTIVAVIDILTGGSVTQLLIFGREASTAAAWTDEIIRLTGGIVIALYAFVTSLYYLASRRQGFKPGFLWLSVILSFYYIVNSATRGWMIAAFFILLFFIIFYFRRVFRAKGTLISLLFLIMLSVILLTGRLESNFRAAFVRLATVEEVAKGDLTAGGTARRFDERGPRALTRFSESPVFGFGFSSVTSQYFDGHVGNHSLLLMGGVTGFAIIWITTLSMIIYILRLELRKNQYKGIFVYGIALTSLLIIHSTSRMMFSFSFPVDAAFLIALFLNSVNNTISKQDNEFTDLKSRLPNAKGEI